MTSCRDRQATNPTADPQPNSITPLHYNWSEGTGCSLNIVFFSQEFSKVCHLSLASTRLLLVVQKLPANRSDCTLALRWELWRSITAMLAREGLQRIVKKHDFFWTPSRKSASPDSYLSVYLSLSSRQFYLRSICKSCPPCFFYIHSISRTDLFPHSVHPLPPYRSPCFLRSVTTDLPLFNISDWKVSLDFEHLYNRPVTFFCNSVFPTTTTFCSRVLLKLCLWTLMSVGRLFCPSVRR